MIGKIIVEEAFHLPEGRGHGANYASAVGAQLLDDQLIDIDGRIAQMDAAGVQLQILSFTSPGVQGESDPVKAAVLARRANDYISEKVKENPQRFAAFGAVSLHDPYEAAAEARRCINELGLCGILVNDFQDSGENGETEIFLDDPIFDPFWSALQELDTPLYIHPRLASPVVFKHLYAKRPWLSASAWGFANGVSLHVLGIICGGVFDRFPRVQLAIGHLGEHLPADLWRIDHKLIRNRFPTMPMNKTKLVRDYMASNVHISTSGHFSDRTLLNCIAELGSDRIMFAVDYPYEDALGEGCAWFDRAPISHSDLAKIGRYNAIKLYKLDQGAHRLPHLETSELGIGGLVGNIYPAHAASLRANS